MLCKQHEGAALRAQCADSSGFCLFSSFVAWRSHKLYFTSFAPFDHCFPLGFAWTRARASFPPSPLSSPLLSHSLALALSLSFSFLSLLAMDSDGGGSGAPPSPLTLLAPVFLFVICSFLLARDVQNLAGSHPRIRSGIFEQVQHQHNTPAMIATQRRYTPSFWLTPTQYRSLTHLAAAEHARTEETAHLPPRQGLMPFLLQDPVAYRVVLRSALARRYLRPDMPIGYLRVDGEIVRTARNSTLPNLLQDPIVQLRTLESQLLPARAVVQALLQHQAATLTMMRIILEPGNVHYAWGPWGQSEQARINARELGRTLPLLPALQQLTLVGTTFQVHEKGQQLLRSEITRACIQTWIQSLQQQQIPSQLDTLHLFGGRFSEQEFVQLMQALPHLRTLALYRSGALNPPVPNAAVALVRLHHLHLFRLSGWHLQLLQQLSEIAATNQLVALRTLVVNIRMSEEEPLQLIFNLLLELAHRLPELHIQVQLQQMREGELNQVEQHNINQFQQLQQQQQHIEIVIIRGVDSDEDEPRSLWQELEW
jgi:hypothetical protein